MFFYLSYTSQVYALAYTNWHTIKVFSFFEEQVYVRLQGGKYLKGLYKFLSCEPRQGGG